MSKTLEELGYRVEINEDELKIYRIARHTDTLVVTIYKHATDEKFRLKVYEQYMPILVLKAIYKYCEDNKWI